MQAGADAAVRSMTPADAECARQLAECAGLSSEDRALLFSYWCGLGNEREPLLDFLIRVGLVASGGPHPVFGVGGPEALRSAVRSYQALVGHAASELGDGTVNESMTGDTVVARPALAVTDTQRVAVLPITRSGRPNPAARVIETPRVGTTLAGYRLTEKLGRGSKGLVFAAEDLVLGRSVAVKILDPEMSRRGSAWTERFLAEARVMARLDHPLILPVHAAGVGNDWTFYAMPRVAAGSTKDLLRQRGPFAPPEATRIIRQAALGLAAAHDVGVAHGNIKPSNLFVGADGTVRLADFAATSAGVRAEDVTTDLRLLGATFHWLLTGRAPGSDDPGVPAEHRAIIARSLQAKPGHGYSSARDFADALGQIAAGPTATRPARSFASLMLPPTGPQPLGPGQKIGKYLLEERLGQGSSGQVFRARHQSLDIPVAVKLLHPSNDGQVVDQLRAEARMLAQLNHPNIVRVWDFDDDPVRPYMVLELVEGKNLGEVIRDQGRIEPAHAARMMRQVAEGLDAAQRIGIVHRDVKPGNILVTPDGIAKLTDLGLAVASRVRGAADAGAGLAGTVAYMPPEQAMSSGDVDHRSDIYALGATLYHMIVGRIPFEGATRMEVILKHIKELPIPPRELVPVVSAELSAVVMKMMAKSPNDRYQSYQDLLRDLHS